jgi:hypothetical protein
MNITSNYFCNYFVDNSNLRIVVVVGMEEVGEEVEMHQEILMLEQLQMRF